MYPLFFIGFMGSGKSTIAEKMSQQYNYSYIDTDEYIESKYEMKISKVFEKYGEETFRQFEHEALHEVLSKDIIATGGGIVERNENIQLMSKKGTIIYLHASFAEIDRRLQGDQSRPLWLHSDLATRQALYNRRHTLYEQCCDYMIRTDGLSIEETVQEIVNNLSLNEHNKL